MYFIFTVPIHVLRRFHTPESKCTEEEPACAEKPITRASISQRFRWAGCITPSKKKALHHAGFKGGTIVVVAVLLFPGCGNERGQRLTMNSAIRVLPLARRTSTTFTHVLLSVFPTKHCLDGAHRDHQDNADLSFQQSRRRV